MHAHAIRDLLARDRQLEACGTRLRDFGVRPRRPEHDDACRLELTREREPFRDGRDAEGRGSRVGRRPRNVERPVTVAVRFDDSPELGAVQHAKERADVAPQRAEIDSELRPVHRAEATRLRRGRPAAPLLVHARACPVPIPHPPGEKSR